MSLGISENLAKHFAYAGAIVVSSAFIGMGMNAFDSDEAEVAYRNSEVRNFELFRESEQHCFDILSATEQWATGDYIMQYDGMRSPSSCQLMPKEEPTTPNP